MSNVKPRVRVRAGSAAIAPAPARAELGYLRDTRSGIVSTRPSYVRDHRDEVRMVWSRAAGIAADIIQNSGRLRGSVDQVLADTVGVELQLSPMPDLAGLGYDDVEKAAFVREIKQRWKRYAWNARECDFRGKFNLPQLINTAIVSHMVFGEAIGILQYMPRSTRKQYGIMSGTKLCMMRPSTLVQDTSEFEGLFQGVIHDPNGRPVAYRFEQKETYLTVKRDYRAFDANGRQVVVHVFDPMDATDVRGISRMAAAFRKHLQHEVLVDATIQTQILQTIFAAALTSSAPSGEAFQAIEELATDGGKQLGAEFMAYYSNALEQAQKGEINISGDPRVSHLAPGEKLELLSTQTPGPQFLPVSDELSRDMARAIGVTFGGLTMNHTNATYSSVRMENASIWPVVLRRREGIAVPPNDVLYKNWLDEEIGEGRLAFKGGYEAFVANRERVTWAQWQGPAKPSADDGKSAKAASERLLNGTSNPDVECAEIGIDPEENFERRVYWHKRYLAEEMPSPFVPRNSAPANDPAAADDPQPVKVAA